VAIKPNTCVHFKWIDDEHCEIYIDENYVGALDHEIHGWAGVEDIVQMLNRMILIKGWDVKVEGDRGV